MAARKTSRYPYLDALRRISDDAVAVRDLGGDCPDEHLPMSRKKDRVLISLIVILIAVSIYWAYKPARGLLCWADAGCFF